ncbi:MAG: serine/threonine-protein kinase [Thermoleophilaceae bacterium]
MSAPEPLPRGAAIAPGYEVITHLRRGNALDVYDVWSDARACRCIVKALRTDRADDSGARRRLLEEGRLLEALSHPHVVRGYETLAGPLPLIVMETLVGETLAHMIEEREVELTVAEVAQLGLHLGSAVGYLHANGYLHLDLKPSNVIAECGRAKLIDLSVARPPGRAHAGIGTWCYMAPEQVRGGLLGPAADVWGIGVVLLEAATGESAFDDEADNPQVRERAPRIDEQRPSAHALSDLVAACLEPEPSDRPAVAELLAALEPVADVPIAERRHAAVAGTGAQPRRR